MLPALRQTSLRLSLGFLAAAFSVLTPQASAAALPSQQQEIIPHEVGGGYASFSLPPEVTSVSLQGFSVRQQTWRNLSTVFRPNPTLSRLKIPQRWSSAHLRVSVNYPAGSSARLRIASKVDSQTREVVFTSTARAKLFSIETRGKSSPRWSRISTVAAPARPRQIRVPLPSSVDSDAEIRVVAVSGSRKTRPNLATPLSAGMRSGPAAFAVGAQAVSAQQLAANGMGGSASVSAPGDSRSGTSPAAEESDIWKIRGSKIYFFNRLRGLQVIDASDPQDPAVVASLPLAAAGEEMYLLGSDPSRVDSALLITGLPWSPGSELSTRLSAIDLRGDAASLASSIDLPGYYVESRLIGGLLHVVTISWSDAAGAWAPQTHLTTVDVSQQGVLAAAPTNSYAGRASQAGSTGKYFWIATDDTGWSQNDKILAFPVKVDGSLGDLLAADPDGYVQDKFKVGDTSDGLAVVVQSWDSSWRQSTSVETFREDNGAFVSAGALELVHGESLFASRFQGDRLYVVTFLQKDPLWVVDLSDASNPVKRGHLEVPGYSNYIQPVGDTLIAVGRDGSNLQVSMFDVSKDEKPEQAARVDVNIDSGWSWSEAEWNEKAVKILPEQGLILLPVVEWVDGLPANKVRLIDFDVSQRKLAARGTIDHAFTPRRAALMDESLIASVSNRELLLVDASDRDKPAVAADVTLAFGVDRVCVHQDTAMMIENGGGPWSGAPAGAILRTAPANDPDAVISEIPLPCREVTAAEVFGEHLVLVENPENEPLFWILAGRDVSGSVLPAGATTGTGASVSVWSIENPAHPSLIGRVSLPFELGQDSEIVAVEGNRIAIVSRNRNWSFWFRPLPVVLDGPVRMEAARLSAMPWKGWGDESLRIAIADISSVGVPSVVGSWQLPEGQNYSNISEVYSAGDLLAFSYDSASRVAPVRVAEAQVWEWDTWQTRSLLQILDLANPASPMPWAPVQLPGKLLGVSWLQRAGGVVFARSGANIAALGFDGENASLAAEVSAGDCAIMQGSTLYAAAATGVAEWSFSEASGRWEQGFGWSFDAGFGLGNLQVFDGALIAGNYRRAWVLREDGSVSGSDLPPGFRLDRAAQFDDGFLVPCGEFGSARLR